MLLHGSIPISSTDESSTGPLQTELDTNSGDLRAEEAKIRLMIPAQFADEFDFELPGSNERHRQKGTRDSIEDCMETTKTACMVQMIKPWRHTEGLKN